MKKLNFKKISAGCYTTTINGTEVEIYRNDEGKYWQIIFGIYGTPEYWTDSANTKAEAVEALGRFIEREGGVK